MRRKNDALRDTLLDLARDIVDQNGIEAVNIRRIAQKAGIAAGTVYNYFSNKDEILLSLTEEYWKQTLTEMETAVAADSFLEQLQQIYGFLKERIQGSGGKLMNSLGSVEMAGQQRMASMQRALEAILILRMEQDTRIPKELWNESFSREKFAHFVAMNLVLLLKTEAPDFEFFIEAVKRILYEY